MNITCEFETDLCNWEVQTTDFEIEFLWKRKNPQEISEVGNEGPDVDHLGDPAGYFIYLSANHKLTEKPFKTNLNSPYLVGKDHPLECLYFVFSFQVSKEVF